LYVYTIDVYIGLEFNLECFWKNEVDTYLYDERTRNRKKINQ